jgi:hypothetical protein
VQWELAGRLGPAPGRYVLRRYAGDEVQAVVIVAEADAAPAERPRRRRRRAVPGPLAAAPVTRVTVVGATPVADGAAWLAAAARDPVVLADAEAALVRLVAAQRVATATPLADPDPAQALAARIGYGTGAQVAEGTWEDAVDLPRESERRARRRAPAIGTERLAALLSGRDAALACEELALRARADLEHDRPREAALQLEGALNAALAELAGWRDRGDLDRRLAELSGYAEPVAIAAAAAREGRLDPAGVETVSAALARLEAALRARTVYGG